MGRKLRGRGKSRSVGNPRRKLGRGRPGDLVWSSLVVAPFVKEAEAVGQVYFSNLGSGVLSSKMEIIGISFSQGQLEDSVK